MDWIGVKASPASSIFLKYAAHFHKSKDFQNMEHFQNNYPLIFEEDKFLNTRTSRNNKKFNEIKQKQREILFEFFSADYIKSHSAKGRKFRRNITNRQKGDGYPAADLIKLAAAQARVKMTFQGQEIPSIESTFNSLANNLRITDKRRKGELKYPNKVRREKKSQENDN